jgi:hypothetical protein
MMEKQDNSTGSATGSMGQVLLLSMRNAENIVAYSANYEFEDIITQTCGADRVDANSFGTTTASRRAYKTARYLSGSPRIASVFLPKASVVKLKRDYEFFFPVFNHPHEIYALSTIMNWREHCRIAACFVGESFADKLPTYLLELLSKFDHIFVGSKSVVDKISRITGRPCACLPFASDVLTFSPIPNQPVRTIDVCNIGRRSQVTHDALITLARSRKIFYHYDTVAASGVGQKQRSFRVGNANEHRLLLANILKRSRYFIANLSRVNEPELNKGRQEIAGRFYEGISAGTVLLGQPPKSFEFNEQFDWPDAVIAMPFDAPDIAQTLSALDADMDRLKRISRTNLYHAALRHDWLYRLQTVFKTVGLSPTPGMIERQVNLQAIAIRALES